MIFQHGDVILQRVDTIPDTATTVDRDNGRVILAYGEVTGHAHAIVAPLDDVILTEIITQSDQDEMAERFLKVQREVALSHEEHATINIPPGNYRVTIQREYSPEELRRVAD